MENVNYYLSGVILPIVLFLASVFFFIRLKGAPLTKISTLTKRMLKKKKGGDTSPLRAVIFALAGTLGVGNIVGVASAIALGGAGAVFWMWVSALFAMILKYSEVVLAVKHRRIRDNEGYGGAMYYMSDLFDSMGTPLLGKIFTGIFVLLCLLNGFTMGGMIQSNSVAEAFEDTIGVPRIFVACIILVILCIVFFANGKRIFDFCEKLVPFVSVVYTVLCLSVIINSHHQIPKIVMRIFKDAFSTEAVGGGAVGFIASRALRYGTIRGLFSNEAGCGTAPMAHATSNTKSPCEQGLLGIFEVFVDTILVCTMTAFVILINGKDINASQPILTVLQSFEITFGEISGILLTVSLFLFALATIICWGYYGKECVYFISKSSGLRKIYFIAYTVCVSLGCCVSSDAVWQAADLAIGLMTPMNLITLLFMSDEIVLETKRYFKK